MAISQYPAGSQGTPGEYGNFTRHSVENAALYKARAVGDHTTKLGACKALRERGAGRGMPLPYKARAFARQSV